MVGAPGTRLAGSTTNSGSAYVFVRSGTTWPFQSQLTQPNNAESIISFGSSVGISGNTALVGTQYGQGAFVFTRSGSMGSLPPPPLPNPGLAFSSPQSPDSLSILAHPPLFGPLYS